MKNKKILIIGAILLLGVSVFLYLLFNGWKKVNIGKGYFEDKTIKLDLDGDKKKEKIDIKKSGKNLYINDQELLVNKYVLGNGEIESKFENNYTNGYYFVDLNKDGVMEIIHVTSSSMISPITNKYTVYNYKNKKIKEVGNLSIIGNIPSDVYVMNNKVKFSYHPFETKKDYSEVAKFELDV